MNAHAKRSSMAAHGRLTVNEVSKMAGISVRTLQYYDSIGLLTPSGRTDAGYRLYDTDDLARLQQILLFRELEFPLKDIRDIIDSPGFDQARALAQQIELLELKREHIDNLLSLARKLKSKGVDTVDFKAFDTQKIDEYTAQAKSAWGDTQAWSEFEQKSGNRSKEKEMKLGNELMELFAPFGRMAAEDADPASDEAIAQARSIQEFITEHYYTCTDEIFRQLGATYGAGGEFTSNIDASAGPGAAEFAAKAIAAYLD